MKILEIIPQLASGGAERFTVDLCNELSKRHNVILLIFQDLIKSDFYVNELSSKVKLICLDKGRGFKIGFAGKVAKVVKTISPDVVHMHLRAVTYLLPCITFMRRIKYYMTIHNAADKEAGGILTAMIRRLCFKLRLVTPVTISEESRQSFEEYYKIREVSMIYNGRNIPQNIIVPAEIVEEFRKYRKTRSTKVIVNLARINVVKRQTVLAKVSKRLFDEGYDFSVLIVGNNNNKTLVNEILSYKCPVVYILGEKRNPLDYLVLSDAYCLCSSYEGMPISLIEALGTETIPICTPVGGIKNILKDGVNGFLTADLSEESLYNTLKMYLTLDEEESKRIAQNAKRTSQTFSMSECAKQYEHLFGAS